MYRKWANIPILFLSIFSFLTKAMAQEGDIRDVHGPVEYPLNPVLIFLVSSLLFLLILFMILRFIKRQILKSKFKKSSLKLPWEFAIDQLAHLKSKNYIETNKFDIFYTELSSILRNYLEDNFSIRAPEMTTEEFLSSIKNNDLLFNDQKEILKKFLSYADMVKFAKFTPSRINAEEGFHLAKVFIEQTKKE